MLVPDSEAVALKAVLTVGFVLSILFTLYVAVTTFPALSVTVAVIVGPVFSFRVFRLH